jgi:hypothetical protein
MKNENRGFSGLDSLASDVDDLLQSAKAERIRNAARAPLVAPHPDESSRNQLGSTVSRPVERDRTIPWAWIVGAIGIGAFIWFGATSKDRPRSSDYSSSSSSQPQQSPQPIEKKPPVGKNLVLNEAQITYCLAENVRMEAANSILDNSSDAQIDRFNSLVDDFNSRCSDYRYYDSNMQRARSNVESRRQALTIEGMNRLR